MVEKMEKLSTKKSLICPQVNFKLTKTEEIIFNYLMRDFKTVKQIANKRGVSEQSVYKIIKKLKNKGALSKSFSKVEKIQGTQIRKIRLHGQEFNIKIIVKSKKYQDSLKRANLIYIDDNTIKLFRNSLEIYGGKSFFGVDEQEAMSISQMYWRYFFNRIENEFNILIVKPRKQNIRLVKQHFAETNSEMAKEYIQRGDAIKVIAEEDGKIWFQIDNSFNLNERECVHPETSKQDSEIISKHLNDWRKNDPPTNSELAIHIKFVVQNQQFYAENIKSHVKAIQDLGHGVRELTKIIKNNKKRHTQ